MKKRVFFLFMAALMMPFAMKAQVNASVHIDNTVNACTSYTWSITGETFTTSGVHTAFVGDTLYILDLSIHATYNDTIPGIIHGGCSYNWANETFVSDGYHTHTFSSVDGCDSIVTINLQLDTIAVKSYTETACESYTWKGTAYTTSGTYNYEDINSNPHCDSLLTLNLTIIQPEEKSYDSTIAACNELRFRFSNNEQAFWIRESRTFTTELNGFDTKPENINVFHPRTVAKCFDSTVTYHITINKTQYTTITDRACDNYSVTVNNNTMNYTSSVVDSLSIGKTVNGCDSMLVLNLTIYKSPQVSISGDLRVTPGTGATLYANCNQSVSYLWYNGSTEDHLTLDEVNQNTDIWLRGTNNTTGCSHTAYATILANVGIDDVDNEMLKVYPNPTSSIVNIEATATVKNVSVYNLMGQQVMNGGNGTVIDLGTLSNGTYILRVELANGSVNTRTVVLKK
jgi:hypothetical protein